MPIAELAASAAADAKPSEQRSSATAAVQGSISGEHRKTVRRRLTEALGGDDTATQLSETAEAVLFENLAPGPRYSRQVRALVFNLRTEGSEFKDALRSGAIPVQALASLPTEAMASVAKQAERKQVRREAMEACEADWAFKHEEFKYEGAFTCGKCGGNHTWYFQFQTRACDEPMEFFVMCRECHHGWRHNDVDPADIFRQVWTSEHL